MQKQQPVHGCHGAQASPGEALFARWMPSTASGSQTSSPALSPTARSTAGAEMNPLLMRPQSAQSVSMQNRNELQPVLASSGTFRAPLFGSAASVQHEPNPLLKSAQVMPGRAAAASAAVSGALASPSASTSMADSTSAALFAGLSARTQGDQAVSASGQHAGIKADTSAAHSPTMTAKRPGAVSSTPSTAQKTLNTPQSPAKWQQATEAVSGQFRTWTAAEAGFKTLLTSAARMATYVASYPPTCYQIHAGVQHSAVH